jgi:hypothetical protein
MGKDEEDESGGDWEEGGGSSRYDLLDYGEESSQKKREAFHADGACECTHACMHYVCARAKYMRMCVHVMHMLIYMRICVCFCVCVCMVCAWVWMYLCVCV